jgi:hypothetical protein
LGELDIGNLFLKSDLKRRAILQRPFPGMAFYTKDDASIFKVRDSEMEDLIAIISNWPITSLINNRDSSVCVNLRNRYKLYFIYKQ